MILDYDDYEKYIEKHINVSVLILSLIAFDDDVPKDIHIQIHLYQDMYLYIFEHILVRKFSGVK
jgi:hypothetical protein